MKSLAEDILEDIYLDGERAGYKTGYDKALAQLAGIIEECKQMGRKEVLDSIGLCVYVWHDEENKVHLCIDQESWQTKLKEWGIND